MKVIAYPYKESVEKDNDLELKLSLRSVEQHWKGGGEVFIFGEIRPRGLSRHVNFLKVERYMPTLHAAIDVAGPYGDILWMNDDIYFNQDTTWDDLISPVRAMRNHEVRPGRLEKLAHKDQWSKKLSAVLNFLKSNDKTIYNFSTHTPYWYKPNELQFILSWCDLGYKTPVETAYYNWFGYESTRVEDQYRQKKKPTLLREMLNDYRFINTLPGGMEDKVLRNYLDSKFHSKSLYEL